MLTEFYNIRMLLANLMQLQDEVIVSDAERLRMTQSNIKMVLSSCLKMVLSSCFPLGTSYFLDTVLTFKYSFQLQRHFQAVALPRIERMRQKEQCLQRHLLRVRTSALSPLSESQN
jgi:nuclear pore complex protein Nup54